MKARSSVKLFEARRVLLSSWSKKARSSVKRIAFFCQAAQIEETVVAHSEIVDFWQFRNAVIQVVVLE
jgi:hypothetical protein